MQPTMLPFRAQLARNFARTCIRPARIAVGFRYQTTVSTEPNPPVKSDAKKKPYVPKPFKTSTKLVDIHKQAEEAVENASMQEAMEIVDEALTYLREIKRSEGLYDRDIFGAFQFTINKLFERGLNGEGEDPETVLDLLKQHDMAHRYLFTQLVAKKLKTVNKQNWSDVSSEVLRLWVKYLEYYNGLPEARYVTLSADFLKGTPYTFYGLTNLVFMCYVSKCVETKAEYKEEDVVKLLQTVSGHAPKVYDVKATLASLGLSSTLKIQFDDFAAAVEEFQFGPKDPNGFGILKKVKNATTRQNTRLLHETYDEMKKLSQETSIPISETSLVNIMNSFNFVGAYDLVFSIFEELLQLSTKIPSERVWDVVVRAMGNPTYLSLLNEKTRAELDVNFEKIIATILAAKISMSPKLLSSIVSSYYNMNEFEKGKEFLEKFPNVARPMSIKNNEINALVLAGKIKEAETLLGECRKDPTYVPTTTMLNTFLSEYAKKKNFKAVENIISYLRSSNLKEDLSTQRILLENYFSLCRMKRLEPDINYVIKNVVKDKRMMVNKFYMTALISGLIKGENISAARLVYQYLAENTPHTAEAPTVMTAMIQGEYTAGSIKRGEMLLDHYVENIENSTRIWNLVIHAMIYRGELQAIEVYKKMKASGAKPNFYTFYYLLSHFSKRQNKEQIQYLLNEIAGAKLASYGKVLPKLIRDLSAEHKVDNELLIKLDM